MSPNPSGHIQNMGIWVFELFSQQWPPEKIYPGFILSYNLFVVYYDLFWFCGDPFDNDGVMTWVIFGTTGHLSTGHRLNKANLMDLIAATGLVILLKFDSNHRFFSPCDPEIWWMTPKNNPAPLLCYFKLCASFRSHWWIQTGVTVRKRQIWVKFNDFLAVWPWNLTDDLKKQ